MTRSPICPECDRETDGYASLPLPDGGRIHVACQRELWLTEAGSLGAEAGRAAASWVLDGNASPEHYARLLRMIDDGDPRAEESLPTRPNLSGEWADSPTPISLYEQITGLDHSEEEDAAGMAYETLIGSVVDAIANAWEEGVSETFEIECERLLRAALAPDTTCGHCGHQWNSVLTPTPASRCPNEYEHVYEDDDA
jgi:hypothetical protein